MEFDDVRQGVFALRLYTTPEYSGNFQQVASYPKHSHAARFQTRPLPTVAWALIVALSFEREKKNQNDG